MGRPSKYPDEFRREAVQLALSSDDSRASVARRLGVNETTLRNWVADRLAEEAGQVRSVGGHAVGVRGTASVSTKLSSCVEREILRKAAAYFAQETIRSAASGSSPSTETPMASSGSVESWESHDRGSMRGQHGPRRHDR